MARLLPVLVSVIQALRVHDLGKSKRRGRYIAIINLASSIHEFLAPVLILTMLCGARTHVSSVFNTLATLSVFILLTETLHKFLHAMTLLEVSLSCFGRVQTFLGPARSMYVLLRLSKLNVYLQKSWFQVRERFQVRELRAA